MGDDQKSCPKKVCLKIFKAISLSPTIQTIRRLSHQPQISLSSDSRPRKSTTRIRSKPNSQSLAGMREKEESGVVQVEFDYSSSNGQTNGQTPHVVDLQIKKEKTNKPKGSVVWKKDDLRAKKPQKSETRNETTLVEAGRTKSGILHNEDYFTDYINRAKLKIRATSNVGDVKNAKKSETELESNTNTNTNTNSNGGGKDNFSDYIRRAKMKIRATSSMTNYSFK